MAATKDIRKTNPDYMLGHALRCNDLPTPGLNYRVKQFAKSGASVGDSPAFRFKFAAVAAAAATLLALSTVALAATGVLGDVFAALSGSQYERTRQTIIEEGLVAAVDGAAVATELGTVPPDVIYDDGLSLRAYYMDGKAVWLDFVLTGEEIPDGFDYLGIFDFTYEMTGADGMVSTWSQQYDLDNDIESRAFPGGHFYHDPKNGVHEYEPGNGNDFIIDARFVKSDNGAYDITVIVLFSGEVVDVGESAHISIGELVFNNPGRLEDDNAVTQWYPIDGSWSFDITIDGKMGSAQPLSYVPVTSGAVQGIEIKSITATPTVTRIEAVIDYANSPLATPENEERARQRVADGDTPGMDYYEFLAKFNLMDTSLSAYDDAWFNTVQGLRQELDELVERQRLAKEQGDEELAAALDQEISDLRNNKWNDAGYHYGGGASSYDPETGINGSVVTCWFEIDSMYFDAPESITLYFGKYGTDVTVEIPIVLVR